MINAQEITARVAADEALRQGAESFATLFEATGDGLIIMEAGAIVAVNQSYAALLGYGRDELVGRDPLDLVAPDERASTARRIGAGVEHPYEVTLRRKDGAVLPVEVVGQNIRYQGRPARLTSVRDITARKAAETALRRSEASLAAAQHLAHLGSWETDLVSGAVHWSDEAFRILGLTPQSVAPSYAAFLAAIHPDDRERVDRASEAGLAAGTPRSIEYRVVHPDGAVRVVQDQSQLLHDSDGRPLQRIGALLDITARQATEAALREREAQFRYLFAGNPHPMWVYDDATLAVLEVNDAAVAHYGYTRGEFLAMTLADFRPPEELDRLQAGVAARRTGHTGPTAARHRLKDGRIIAVEIRSTPLSFAGRPARLVVAQDVTERKALEARLAHQATHDPLTGLPNRALFLDRLGQALARAPARRRALRGPLPRPRPLQGGQRHPRPRRGRPPPRRGGRAAARRPARRGHPGAPGRRRVRRPAGRRGGRGRGGGVAERLAAALAAPLALDGQEHRVAASIGIVARRAGPRARRRICCATPTSRCTAPRRRAGRATPSSTRRCRPRWSRAWRWSATCARRWSAASSRSTTSRSSTSPAGASPRSRRWCAGGTPTRGDRAARRRSSRWPRRRA